MEVKTKKKVHILLWCEVGLLVVLVAVALFALLLRPSREPSLGGSTPGGQTSMEVTENSTGQTEESTEFTQATEEITGPTRPANPYGPNDFGYIGDYMACIPDESVLGIDVSTFQRGVDWQQVKAAGIEFVIIRLGHRGTNIGVLYEDDDAQAHYQGAIAAGLKVGGYFYSQAITAAEAKEEAELCLQVVEGWTVEMPIVFDWEHIDADCRTVNMDPRTLTDCAKAFCQTIEDAGYKTMIYFNQRQAMTEPMENWPVHDRYYLEELTDYGFWLAMYEAEMTFPTRIDMWQYTNTGSVPGINGNVDINLYLPNARNK